MAETTTIARPYARAAFETARGEDGGLANWSGMLQFAASVAAEPTVATTLASPTVDDQHKAGLMLDIGSDRFNPSASNFIKVLAENQRLTLLPEIFSVYEELKADAEKTVEAEVVSAFEITAAQQEKIAAALSKRLNREVVLNCTVDESLLGGAIIRAGDLVIDGSARGKLTKLTTALSQ